MLARQPEHSRPIASTAGLTPCQIRNTSRHLPISREFYARRWASCLLGGETRRRVNAGSLADSGSSAHPDYSRPHRLSADNNTVAPSTALTNDPVSVPILPAASFAAK